MKKDTTDETEFKKHLDFDESDSEYKTDEDEEIDAGEVKERKEETADTDEDAKTEDTENWNLKIRNKNVCYGTKNHHIHNRKII